LPGSAMIRVDRSDNSSARALTEATIANMHRQSMRPAGNGLFRRSASIAPDARMHRSLSSETADSPPGPVAGYDRIIHTLLTTAEMRLSRNFPGNVLFSPHQP
jgi:hypothetical protein